MFRKVVVAAALVAGATFGQTALAEGRGYYPGFDRFQQTWPGRGCMDRRGPWPPVRRGMGMVPPRGPVAPPPCPVYPPYGYGGYGF